MSASIRRCSLMAGLLLALCYGSAAFAQLPRDGSDLLDQARRLKEVAAQKLEVEVRDALRQAQTADPASAQALLKQTLAVVEQDTALSLERRDLLRRLLKDRLRIVEAENARNPAPATKPRPITPSDPRVDAQTRLLEQQQVDKALGTIRKLQSEGRNTEADRMANDLRRQYPNNVAAQAAGRVAQAADRLVDIRTLRTEGQRRFNGTMASVERSSMPAVDDVEFPSDWRAKSERRAKLLVQMTAKEKAILDALNSPVSVNFKGSRFEDVIRELEKVSGQSILLDKQSLDEAQISYETPINVTLNNVTLRTALRKVLADLGLAYVIKDQTIQVMSAPKTRELMTVRSYYIGDLLFVAGFTLPPAYSQLQMAQTVSQLVDMVQRTIDPGSWQINGGPGSVTFYPATMSLVIKQSAEMHFVIGGGIGGASR